MNDFAKRDSVINAQTLAHRSSSLVRFNADYPPRPHSPRYKRQKQSYRPQAEYRYRLSFKGNFACSVNRVAERLLDRGNLRSDFLGISLPKHVARHFYVFGECAVI